VAVAHIAGQAKIPRIRNKGNGCAGSIAKAGGMNRKNYFREVFVKTIADLQPARASPDNQEIVLLFQVPCARIK